MRYDNTLTELTMIERKKVVDISMMYSLIKDKRVKVRVSGMIGWYKGTVSGWNGAYLDLKDVVTGTDEYMTSKTLNAQWITKIEFLPQNPTK